MNRDESTVNRVFARLLEIIDFSEKQLRKLGEQQTFNHHVKMMIPEMGELIGIACEAGASSAELAAAVAKYCEYTARAGEAELNAQYEDLKKYDAFREALSALKNH